MSKRLQTPVPQRYIFLGLTVAGAKIADTENHEETVRHYGNPRLRRVTEHDILSTRRAGCNCESHGLFADMTVDQLMRLGSGCTGSDQIGVQGYVCPRLVNLRRTYGH